MAFLNETLHGAAPVNSKLNLDMGFANSPDGRRNFTIDRDEAKNFLAAIGPRCYALERSAGGR
jgi:hypothetical protein